MKRATATVKQNEKQEHQIKREKITKVQSKENKQQQIKSEILATEATASSISKLGNKQQRAQTGNRRTSEQKQQQHERKSLNECK